MIQKSIIWFLTLSVLYTGIQFFVDPKTDSFQTAGELNLIKAQEYLYSKNQGRVIVGSSLSARIKTENLPEDIVNLGFAGSCISDGLEIIKKGNKKPTTVFVEMNFASKPMDQQFINDLFTNLGYHSKKYWAVLREKYQPVGMLKYLAFSLLEKKVTNRGANAETGKPKLIKKVADINKKNFEKEPSDEKLDNSFEKLKKQIKEIEKEGICVVFFEMPVEDEFADLIMPTKMRTRFFKEFPKEKYKYIDQPDCKEYHTFDGIHLYFKSAEKYTDYFNEHLPLLSCAE